MPTSQTIHQNIPIFAASKNPKSTPDVKSGNTNFNQVLKNEFASKTKKNNNEQAKNLATANNNSGLSSPSVTKSMSDEGVSEVKDKNTDKPQDQDKLSSDQVNDPSTLLAFVGDISALAQSNTPSTTVDDAPLMTDGNSVSPPPNQISAASIDTSKLQTKNELTADNLNIDRSVVEIPRALKDTSSDFSLPSNTPATINATDDQTIGKSKKTTEALDVQMTQFASRLPTQTSAIAANSQLQTPLTQIQQLQQDNLEAAETLAAPPLVALTSAADESQANLLAETILSGQKDSLVQEVDISKQNEKLNLSQSDSKIIDMKDQSSELLNKSISSLSQDSRQNSLASLDSQVRTKTNLDTLPTSQNNNGRNFSNLESMPPNDLSTNQKLELGSKLDSIQADSNVHNNENKENVQVWEKTTSNNQDNVTITPRDTDKLTDAFNGQLKQERADNIKLNKSESTEQLSLNSNKAESVAVPSAISALKEINSPPPLTEHIAPRVGSKGWDQAIGQKIVWMVAGGDQTAQLTLNPPDLGPVQVVLSISDNFVDASFVSSHLDVREAIEAAAPKLREMMDSAGISLSGFSVSAESAQSGGSFSAEKFQHGASSQAREVKAAANNSVDVSINSAVIRKNNQEHSLVDTFA